MMRARELQEAVYLEYLFVLSMLFLLRGFFLEDLQER
jgi:hypothetical protein